MNRHVVQREMNLLNRGRLNRALLIPEAAAQPTSIGSTLREITKPIPNVGERGGRSDHLDGLNKLCNILVGLPCEPAAHPRISKVKFQDESEENVDDVDDVSERDGRSGKFEPIPVISKAEKVSKTPTQLKVEVEKKKQKAEDAELIQKELNKKPQKPAEKLLNKLLKKQDRRKIPSHIKKAIRDIREFEKKRDTQVGTNNKILDAIKNAYA